MEPLEIDSREFEYALYAASDAMRRFTEAVLLACDPCCGARDYSDPANDLLFMRRLSVVSGATPQSD